ncbi:zinc finger, CCCH-type containing protein [Tanacetum coccineum]
MFTLLLPSKISRQFAVAVNRSLVRRRHPPLPSTTSPSASAVAVNQGKKNEYESSKFTRVRDGRDEYKQVQKKSVLQRIGKDRVEGGRENSLVELDMSFQSNGLVAKAVASPTSPDTPSRNRKIKRGSEFGSPVSKFVMYIIAMSASKDRGWMYKRRNSEGHLCSYYQSKVSEFLNFAFSIKKVVEVRTLGSKVVFRIKCPCSICKIKVFKERHEVEYDLWSNGFIRGYTTWYAHGERKSKPKEIGKCSKSMEVDDDAVEAAMEDEHGPDASQHPPNDFDLWGKATGGKKKGKLVGLGTRGDPRLMVTSRTSTSSSSSHTGSQPSEQEGLIGIRKDNQVSNYKAVSAAKLSYEYKAVQNLEEMVKQLQEDNAQMRGRSEIEMQVQVQRQVESQLQEHMRQRELELNAREEAREREWQRKMDDIKLDAKEI